MNRTEHDLHSALTEMEVDPASEQRLRTWLSDRERRASAPAHHRRVWLGPVLAAATVAVVAVAVPLVERAGGPGPAAASPTSQGSGGASQPNGPLVPATPQVLVSTLTGLLPPRFAGVSQPWGRTISFPVATGLLDDGSGAALISVVLGAGGIACPDGALGTCETLVDGTQLRAYQGPADPGAPQDGVTEWSISILRPDGLRLDLSEYNSAESKQGTPSRSEPPLTQDELRGIALSAQWAATVPVQVVLAAEGLFTPER